VARGLNHFFITVIILGFIAVISSKISILKKYRIPISLTSSILVLIIFASFPDLKSLPIYSTWKTWPGIFIALIFAALFLERSEENTEIKKNSDLNESFLQTILVYITIVGQMIIGLALCLILFKPVFNLPLAFGSVLETGFAGGHGTAVAMNKTFLDNGLLNGQEYGLFSATVGLILGIVGGIILIKKESGDKSFEVEEEKSKIELDPIKVIITLFLIFLAYIIGDFLKENLLNNLSYINESSPFAFILRLKDLPLFIFTLLAGVSLKMILKFIRFDYLIENGLINLVSNVFMELLIFAGIASIDMKVISNALLPLLILFTAGFVWNLFCHFVVRKKLIKESYSFEISLINFGMVNGTTGIGLMLLKMVDPECKTKALKVYAESAPFTSPMVGGGILTLALPYLVTNGNPYWILLLLIALCLNLYFIGKRIRIKLDKAL
jgi:glutamate:Na+ symporter, ESS family